MNDCGCESACWKCEIVWRDYYTEEFPREWTQSAELFFSLFSSSHDRYMFKQVFPWTLRNKSSLYEQFSSDYFFDFNIVTGGLFCWLSWVTLILSGTILAGVRKFCSWKFWEGKCTVSLFVFRFLCSWMSPCIIVRRHLPLGQWFLVRIRQVDLEQESAGDSGCLCVSSTSCPKISLTTRCIKQK